MKNEGESVIGDAYEDAVTVEMQSCSCADRSAGRTRQAKTGGRSSGRARRNPAAQEDDRIVRELNMRKEVLP